MPTPSASARCRVWIRAVRSHWDSSPFSCQAIKRGSGAKGRQSADFRLGRNSQLNRWLDGDSAEEILKGSEVLEVRISRDQLFSAEHIATAFGLPDHLKRHQFRGGGGSKDAQGFAQGFTGVGSAQFGPGC